MTTVKLPESMLGYGVELTRLRAADIELVRTWRNHPEVARHMLTNDYITQDQQIQWFKRIDDANDRAYYIAHFKNQPTAFASVTGKPGINLADCKVLEAAIYLAPESRYRGTVLAFAPALVLNDACFEILACDKLTAQVKVDNETALRFNAQMGYEEIGRNSEMVYLELDHSRYIAASQPIKQILTRQQRTAF